MRQDIENYDDIPKIAEISHLPLQDLQECSNLIKQRVQFYREENAQMESIFKKLKLLNEELKLTGLGGSVESLLDQYLTDFEASKTGRASALNTERLRKHNNYLSKLKTCVRYYINMNDVLSKEIKNFKSEMENSTEYLKSTLKLSPQDVKQMEKKAKNYEVELVKFQKKYPWLKDPEYNLPNIKKHIDSFKSLKEEKDSLVKELSVYHNLKPDLKEAKQQLAEIKEEMNAASLKYNNIVLK